MLSSLFLFRVLALVAGRFLLALARRAFLDFFSTRRGSGVTAAGLQLGSLFRNCFFGLGGIVSGVALSFISWFWTVVVCSTRCWGVFSTTSGSAGKSKSSDEMEIAEIVGEAAVETGG
jgi:hypothetical protein